MTSSHADAGDPEVLYASLRPILDKIDLDKDLNERDTPGTMSAMSISASSGDEQTYSDEWIKLCILVERDVITGDQLRSMVFLPETDR